MQSRIVSGIYIKRTGLTVLSCEYDEESLPKIHTQRVLPPIGPDLKVIAHDKRSWHSKDTTNALIELRTVMQDVAHAYPDTHSVAIAGFGTFVSLMRTSEDYGLVHPNFGHDPFKGINLHSEARTELLNCGLPESLKVSVHTDAHAFTLGEAIVRGNVRNHLLVGILCTEGIGGGIVRGNSTFQSRLHPEFGLITPRIHYADDMKPEPEEDEYALFSKSMGEVASNEAMRKRYAKANDKYLDDVTDKNLVDLDAKHWDLRAYYLAQLCFISASLLTPHGIVLAADLDPNSDLLARVQEHFSEIVRTRVVKGQPMISYKEFDDAKSFISTLSPYKGELKRSFPEPEISVTGALGACLLAARVSRGGPTK